MPQAMDIIAMHAGGCLSIAQLQASNVATCLLRSTNVLASMLMRGHWLLSLRLCSVLMQINSEYLEAIKVIKTRCVRLKTRAETVSGAAALPDVCKCGLACHSLLFLRQQCQEFSCLDVNHHCIRCKP